MDATSGGYNVRWESGRLRRENSSARYKKNIKPLEDNFDKILQVAPKSYTDQAKKGKHIGYIAEEFANIGLENLVIYDEQGKPDAIRYDHISIYLVEVVKELKAENDDLKHRIELLEQRQ
jgi:hypothetical protein